MSGHQGQEALLTGEQGGLWGVKWCGKGWRGARPKGPVEIGMRTNKGIEEEAGDRRIQRGFKGPPMSISVHKDQYLSLFCRYEKIKNIPPWALLRFCGGFCLFCFVCFGFAWAFFSPSIPSGLYIH